MFLSKRFVYPYPYFPPLYVRDEVFSIQGQLSGVCLSLKLSLPTDLSPSSYKDSLIERGLHRTVLFPSGHRTILLCLLSSSQMPVYKSLPPASTSAILLRCGIRRLLGSTVLPFGNCSDEGYKYLLKCRSRWISFHHYLFLKRSLLSPGHLLTLMATVTRISVEMHADSQVDQKSSDKALLWFKDTVHNIYRVFSYKS